jgi:hypothetical protein
MPHTHPWYLVHNAVVHPLMVVLPRRLGEWMHEITARLAFGGSTPREETRKMLVSILRHI